MASRNRMFSITKNVVGYGAIAYLLAIAAIWSDGYFSTYEKSEYAIVLGNQVYPSGEPSNRLKARLNRAMELYREGSVVKIIVSGGFGKEGHDEAKVMQKYLISQGISSTDILVDSCGNNTRMTAQNSLRWLKHKKQNSVIVVSQLYHVSRSKLAFHQLGFKKVGVAWPNYFERRDIYASVREVLAWAKYWLVY